MITSTVFVATLFGIIQSVPPLLSFLINGAVVIGTWLLLRKQAKDEFSIRIVNHTTVLIATWVLISGMIGLFFTFAELEAAANNDLFNGFLYGFRITMAILPLGILAGCAPVIWFLSARHASN